MHYSLDVLGDLAITFLFAPEDLECRRLQKWLTGATCFDKTEHVLKPSASFPALSLALDNNRPSTVRTDGSIRKSSSSSDSSNKKPSPTPSIKRSKAELLLKDHGSPPGLRVTAGGRIVPVEFTPIGSPRHGYRNLNGARHFSRYGHEAHHLIHASGHDMALPNGYVAYNVLGQLCQFVDGNMLPLKFTISGPQMYLPPVNFPFPTLNSALPEYGNFYTGDVPVGPLYPHQIVQAMDTQTPGLAPAATQSGPANSIKASLPNPHTNGPSRPVSFNQGSATDPSDQHRDIDVQITMLNEEYSRVRQEKIEYERDEIRYSGNITAAGRANIVERKKDYVIRLDMIRKQVKELSEAKANGSKVVEVVPIMSHQPALLPTAPPFKPYPGIGLRTTVLPVSQESSVPELTSRESNTYKGSEAEPVSSEKKARSSSNGPSPPSRGTRRSHAIEIKDPRTVPNVASKSTLDPTSPSYEPARPTTGHKVEVPPFVPPSPSPIASPKAYAAIQAQYPWVFKSDKDDGSVESHNGRHRASFSSVTTTDLFPHDTEEHSLTKYKHKAERDSIESNVSATPTVTTPAKDQIPRSVDRSNEEPSPDYYGSKRLCAPPVSPADFRTSSFLRDVNPSPEEEVRTAASAKHDLPRMTTSSVGKSLISNTTSGNSIQFHVGQIPWSKLLANTKKQLIAPRIAPLVPTPDGPSKLPIREETYQEFDGKSDVYLRGYIAGLSGQAPGTNKSHDWLQGYCAALMKPTDKNPRRSENNSNVSIKTESIETKFTTASHPSTLGHATGIPVNVPHHSVQGPAVPQHLENTQVYSVSNLPVLGPQYNPPPIYGSTHRELQRRLLPYQNTPSAAMYGGQAPRFPGTSTLSRSFSDGLYIDQANVSTNFRDDSAMGATYSAPTGPFLTGFSGNRIEYGPRSTSASLSHAWVFQQQEQANQPWKKGYHSSSRWPIFLIPFH